MKKAQVKYKSLLIIVLAMLFFTLVPLLLISRFNVPCADDFTYGAAAHLEYAATGSVLKAVSAALGQVRESYFGWQGTFTAVLMMALQPAVFGEQYYCIGAFIVLATFLAGVFCLCLALFSGVFGIKKTAAAAIGGIMSIVCIQLVPSPVQGFFWYNGSVYYTFFYGVSLLAFALGIRTVRGRSPWYCVGLSLMAAFLGGGNYVTALSCAIVGVSAAALLALIKNPGWRRLLLPLGVLLAAFYISFSAPGNSVRQAAVQHVPNAVRAVLDSFKYGAEYSARWFSLPLAGALAFMLPLFWGCVRGLAYKFRYPGLVTLFSYCLLSAMFCPTAYALGSVGDKRLLNIIFFAYVLLLAVNLFYWTGWVAGRRGCAAGDTDGVRLRDMAVTAAICLVCCGIYIRSGGFTSLMAAGSLRSGEAAAYYACARTRLDALNDPQSRNAVLEEYPVKPYVLFFDDITADPDDWRNQSVSVYYSKESVVLGTP